MSVLYHKTSLKIMFSYKYDDCRLLVNSLEGQAKFISSLFLFLRENKKSINLYSMDKLLLKLRGLFH